MQDGVGATRRAIPRTSDGVGDVVRIRPALDRALDRSLSRLDHALAALDTGEDALPEDTGQLASPDRRVVVAEPVLDVDTIRDEIVRLRGRAAELLDRVRGAYGTAAGTPSTEPGATPGAVVADGETWGRRPWPEEVAHRESSAAVLRVGARRAPATVATPGPTAGPPPWAPPPPPRWTEPAPGSAHTPRAEITRRRLLLAAAERFAARGYHGTSVSDILAAGGQAGTRPTKGALYFHFSSKHRLALALAAEANRSWERVVDEIDSRGLDPLWTMLATCDAAVAASMSDPVIRAVLRIHADDVAFGALVRAGEQRALERTHQLLREARARNLLHPMVDAAQAAHAVHRLLAGHRATADHLEELWDGVTAGFWALLPAVVTEPWLRRWRSSGWCAREVPRTASYVDARRPG